MRIIKKFFDWLSNVLPIIWGLMWMLIITAGSIALLITVGKWLMRLLGVM